MNSPSGVNASGPLIMRTISASRIAGTSEKAPFARGSKRSQSSSSRVLLKSMGGPSCQFQGAGSRS